ncbi:MAG: hypothetical protein FWH15_06675 [Betaproteobacteria bacterium]|nr:hypothetical protein [Betaproteobacteria bacterium]
MSSLTDLIRRTAGDAPSERSQDMPRPPKANVPTRIGEAYSPTSGGQGGGGTFFEEQSVLERQWHTGGFVSSDGIFWFPAIRLVSGKFGEYLRFAAPES